MLWILIKLFFAESFQMALQNAPRMHLAVPGSWSMDNKWVIYNLLINGVYWSSNPLITDLRSIRNELTDHTMKHAFGVLQSLDPTNFKLSNTLLWSTVQAVWTFKKNNCPRHTWLRQGLGSNFITIPCISRQVRELRLSRRFQNYTTMTIIAHENIQQSSIA